MPNQELFRKIHKQITTDPLSHDQGTWENEGVCGTTRCIAGWAVYFAQDGNRSVEEILVEKFGEGADDRDLSIWDYIQGYAAKLLGIDARAAEHLFLNASASDAVALVAGYAGVYDQS